jgi:hypothetical protein
MIHTYDQKGKAVAKTTYTMDGKIVKTTKYDYDNGNKSKKLDYTGENILKEYTVYYY